MAPVAAQRRTARSVALAMLLASAGGIEAAAGAARLSAGGTASPETLPGRILTLGFRAANDSPGERRFMVRTQLPEGWRLLTPVPDASLGPGTATLKLVTFSVPAAARAGDHPVRVSLFDPVHPADTASVTTVVRVLAVRHLRVTVLEGPKIVASGEPFDVRFDVTNLGNAESRVRLAGRASAGPCWTPDSLLRLPPGGSRELRVTAYADPLQPPSPAMVVTLNARTGGDSVVAAEASHIVEVIPPPEQSGDPWVRLPLFLTGRLTGDGSRSGGQVELAGEGPLDETGRHRLGVILRGPDRQQVSQLGLRDEYAVRYRAPDAAAQAGDAVYELTPLTEYGRYAMGVGGIATEGDVTVGGFVNTARFLVPRETELGFTAGVSPVPRTNVSLQYLGKRNNGETDILSLRGRAQPYAGDEVDLEYGLGWLDGRRDEGYSLRLTGSHTAVSYDLRHVYGGPDFNGYYRDGRYTMASLAVMPGGLYRLEGFFRQSDRNLALDPGQLFAPMTRLYQAGAGYAGFLYVGFRREEFEDRLPSPQFSRVEHTGQVRAGYNTAAAGFLASVEVGRVEDRLLGTDGPFRRINVTADVRPSPQFAYGFTVESSREQNLFGDERPERVGAGARVVITPMPRTRFFFDGYYSRTLVPLEQSTLLLDAAAEHVLPFGHIVALRYRGSRFLPSPVSTDHAWRVDYTVPVDIPVVRRNGTGELAGRVVDDETGRGIAGVVVRTGGTLAMTEEDGAFRFPPLPPARYYLQPDVPSMGYGVIPARPLDAGVYVGPGAVVDVVIPVTRAAQLTGSVLRRALRDSLLVERGRPPELPLGGAADVIVEATNGTETLRRLTDSRGSFRFERIRPGRWVVGLVPESIPPGHRVERDTIDVPLAPGEARDVEFLLTARERTIRIVTPAPIPLSPPQPPPAKKPARRR